MAPKSIKNRSKSSFQAFLFPHRFLHRFFIDFFSQLRPTGSPKSRFFLRENKVFSKNRLSKITSISASILVPTCLHVGSVFIRTAASPDSRAWAQLTKRKALHAAYGQKCRTALFANPKLGSHKFVKSFAIGLPLGWWKISVQGKPTSPPHVRLQRCNVASSLQENFIP